MIIDASPDLGTLKRASGNGHSEIFIYNILDITPKLAESQFCDIVIMTFPDWEILIFLHKWGKYNIL